MTEKYLKCSCAHCGKHIEYPAQAAGDLVECPHCHQQTELTVEVPEFSAPEPRRGRFAWMLIALIIIGAAAALAPAIARRMLAKSRRKAAP